jgi:hypothetical protein
VNSLGHELEAIFGQAGRRWKSAAAEALRISRPTLYRYLAIDDDALAVVLPHEIRARVTELAKGILRLPSARELAVSYAKGLIQLQDLIDRDGYITAPYSAELLRALSIAAALNLQKPAARYPDNIADLLDRASHPFHEWFSDLDWDAAGDFTTARLIRHGVISTECLLLASTPADFDERVGYDLLINRCRSVPSGQSLYVAWRRLLIEQPVVESFSQVLRDNPVFMQHIDVIAELAEFFMEHVPRPPGDPAAIALCPVTSTRVTWFENEWISESRDPDIQAGLRASKPKCIQWTPETRQVKRTFRQFWTLPGYYELELYRHAQQTGWECELWPKFDAVDLLLRKGDVAYALDVKDHLNSTLLARRFEGFRGYEREHKCFVVVPDYLTRIDRRYRTRFNAVRRAQGSRSVDLCTVSEILDLMAETA